MNAYNKAILHLTFLQNFCEAATSSLVACHWSHLCETVGGPTAAKNHSRTVPLPSTPLPLQTRSPTQLSVQPLFSAQRSSHSEKRALNQLREEEGGKRERENALEAQLIKKIEKEWQNPNRLRSRDWKKRFSWAGEKGQSFPGCSSWCETSWAQRLRTGKDELFFHLWLMFFDVFV